MIDKIARNRTLSNLDKRINTLRTKGKDHGVDQYAVKRYDKLKQELSKQSKGSKEYKKVEDKLLRLNDNKRSSYKGAKEHTLRQENRRYSRKEAKKQGPEAYENWVRTDVQQRREFKEKQKLEKFVKKDLLGQRRSINAMVNQMTKTALRQTSDDDASDYQALEFIRATTGKYSSKNIFKMSPAKLRSTFKDLEHTKKYSSFGNLEEGRAIQAELQARLGATYMGYTNAEKTAIWEAMERENEKLGYVYDSEQLQRMAMVAMESGLVEFDYYEAPEGHIRAEVRGTLIGGYNEAVEADSNGDVNRLINRQNKAREVAMELKQDIKTAKAMGFKKVEHYRAFREKKEPIPNSQSETIKAFEENRANETGIGVTTEDKLNYFKDILFDSKLNARK